MLLRRHLSSLATLVIITCFADMGVFTQVVLLSTAVFVGDVRSAIIRSVLCVRSLRICRDSRVLFTEPQRSPVRVMPTRMIYRVRCRLELD